MFRQVMILQWHGLSLLGFWRGIRQGHKEFKEMSDKLIFRMSRVVWLASREHPKAGR